MPGFLLKAVNEILQESKVDYSTLLRNFALETIKKSRQRSWTRLNRKYPNQIRGNAKKIIDTNNLLIVMDTSGSMWHDELLDKVIAEIKKIRTICPNLWIVGGDVQENFRIQTKDDFKFSHLTLSGGGGTDLQFGFNAASELKVSGTIVLTDGFIPEFNNYDIDTVFVIVPGGEAVEGFRNIFLT
jgi:predicted metal-dependent peptidase